jgi:hypothetical protein
LQNVPVSVYVPWKKPGTSATEGLYQDFVQKYGTSAGRILQTLQSRHQPMNFKSYPTEPSSVVWEDSWSSDKTDTRDPSGADLLKNLAAELKKQNAKFTDPFFPPDASSLYVDPTKKFQDFLEGHYSGNIVWKRPSELFPEREIKVTCPS